MTVKKAKKDAEPEQELLPPDEGGPIVQPMPEPFNDDVPLAQPYPEAGEPGTQDRKPKAGKHPTRGASRD